MVNRHVDFAPVGLVAGGVHEDEVSVGDLVGGKARMVQDQGGDFLLLGQASRALGFAEHHRVAEKAPRLTAGPPGTAGGALMGDARAGGAGSGIVVDDVKAAPVGTEVFLQGGVGVGGRDFTETRKAADAGGPQEKFAVHHVVDDDGEIPAVAFVPGRDGADFGSETGAEGVGTGEENVPVGGVTAEAEVVAEASGAREADVVRAAARSVA